MSIPWIKKYLSKKPSDIRGQKGAMAILESFISGYKKQKKKAVIIYGPSGCGKTSSVYALAEKHNLEVLETNASDFRTKDKINERVGAASKQMSLFSKGKVILIDEIDGLSGRKDRGGLAEVARLIADSAFPIIMTASNPWDSKFSTLRRKCTLIQFNALDASSGFEILKNICDSEKIKYEDLVLKSLARRTGGDMRAAINDLQTIAHEHKEVTRAGLDELSERNQIETMPSALVRVFKNSDPKIALSAFDNVNEDFDQRFLWIDHNLPLEYKGMDLLRAYDSLSKADVFRGRIRRWQHWRFLVYVNMHQTAGIAAAKENKYRKFVQYKPTDRILKLWKAKMKYHKRKAIAQKIAEKTHSSKRRVIQDTLPFFQMMIKKDKNFASLAAQEFDLDEAELAWLKK